MFRIFYDILQWNLKCLTPNNNHQEIQTHHSIMKLLFYIHCFFTVVLYFSQVIYKWVLKSSIFAWDCGKLRRNLCGSFILLFYVFMNIVFVLIFKQKFTSLICILCSAICSMCFIIMNQILVLGYYQCFWSNLNK